MANKFRILSINKDSKGLKLFSSSAYKEHERIPMASLFWEMRAKSVIWLLSAFALILAFPAEHIWRYGTGIASIKWLNIYFYNLLHTFGLSVLSEVPDWLTRVLLRTDIQCIVPLFSIVIYYILTDKTLMGGLNPYSGDKFSSKSSKKASKEDIEKMGLFKGFMMVLGYFKKKPLMMNECLSTLCLAPPGTGKTQGVVLPTIFESNSVSLIINDPKPELKQLSSGYRSSIGPVFIMNWAGQDDPYNGIYYPSWNPLSPDHIPFEQDQRDLYIDSMCNILIKDAGANADPHWVNTARAGLAGFIQFIVSKIERAKADDYFYSRLENGTFDKEDAVVLSDYYISMTIDPNAYTANALLQEGNLNIDNYVHIGTWNNIPDSWVGREASLAMILDWINANQLRMIEELEDRKKQGDFTVQQADPMGDILTDSVNEAKHFSYSHRAIVELTQLANTPDKERGSIISTLMVGLAIFRNAAVRNRTSHSDFHFTDMRGLLDPRDGKIKPVTVYLSINMVDAAALNPITGIFIELMSSYLLANTPNSIHNGQKLGPYPVLFVLDEMPKMQKLQAVIQGPDLGRGQKISYLIIGQDIHQIAERYGEPASKTIISTTAAKIILRQNDLDTAKTFSEMMGTQIKIKTDDNGKDSESEEPLYTPMDIMKLSKDKQIVMFQGFYNRPIEADHQQAWQDERLKKFMEMGESTPIPEFLIPKHHKIMGYKGNPKVYNPATGEIKNL